MSTTRIVAAALTAALGLTACDNDDGSFGDSPGFIVPGQGDTIGLTRNNELVTFDRNASGGARLRSLVAVTGLQAGETLLGIDTRPGGPTPGELYGLGSTGRIYTLNATTGVATQKSVLSADSTDMTDRFMALNGTDFGVDFNPVVDRLRVVSDTGQNLRINVDTGAVTTDGPLNIGGTAVAGVSAAAYTNAFGAACRTTLYYLDTTADRLLSTTDPNNGVLSVVGALGVNAESANGFEIVTAADGSNTGFATLTVGGVVHLYTLSLMTGAASDRGPVTGVAAQTLRGLTFGDGVVTPTAAQGAGELLALTETNKLLSFTAGAPQKVCTSTAITGLQASENVLGIDVRPADGALYALGSSGRLYTVDRASGAATMKSMLMTDTTDMTDPFSALAGTDFGVDFNPVPDRLRVVSNTGQSLRINVDTGVTTTDTALNPAGSTVTAAAYTNGFAGAATTTLYVLDVANDRLMVQGQPSGNPNNGDLQVVGSLALGTAAMSVDIQAAGGFDVNGRTNVAMAALTSAGASTSDLYTINLTSGAATRVNTIGGGERVRGFAMSAIPQASVIGVTTDQRLITFKPTTPATLDSNTAITGMQGGESIVAVDTRPANSRIYALTDAGRLYTIDAATAAATITSAPLSVALSGTAFGGDFNPVVDRLRIVSNLEQNLRANVDTGATTTDTNLQRAPFGVSAAAYTNSFAGATATTLYVIDTDNDRLLTQNPPNNGTLNDVGPLGIDVDLINGFDIVGPDTALAVLGTAAQPAALYGINLTTGAATLVGAVALPVATDRVTGIATPPSMATPAASSTVYAVLNGTALTSFARNAPATLSAPLAITGLQANETLFGIDFRPASGVLFGLGSTGRLYTIDPTTAVATAGQMLTNDPADMTDPFMGLSSGMRVAYGVDFNPVADRLRVVSLSGQNLRANVDTGLTTTDGALNYPVPDASAAAYTRNFAGTATTSLYVIDVVSNTLLLQNPPNDGVLTTVGRLDPMQTFTTTAAFDIAGGDDGLVLAVLQPSAATQSTLYRVNLRTGAATAVGVIGASGTPLVRAATIRLQ